MFPKVYQLLVLNEVHAAFAVTVVVSKAVRVTIVVPPTSGGPVGPGARGGADGAVVVVGPTGKV